MWWCLRVDVNCFYHRSDNALDYVFAHFCGIYMASTVYFLIYCMLKVRSRYYDFNRIMIFFGLMYSQNVEKQASNLSSSGPSWICFGPHVEYWYGSFLLILTTIPRNFWEFPFSTNFVFRGQSKFGNDCCVSTYEQWSRYVRYIVLCLLNMSCLCRPYLCFVECIPFQRNFWQKEHTAPRDGILLIWHRSAIYYPFENSLEDFLTIVPRFLVSKLHLIHLSRSPSAFYLEGDKQHRAHHYRKAILWI
jgi:hypothetical protein